LKIEVKKKIDVIFDCRRGQERRKVISELKCNRDFEKNYCCAEKKSLMLAVSALIEKEKLFRHETISTKNSPNIGEGVRVPW
jgi:hypothetical protein